MTTRDLVIGSAIGYDSWQLMPFIRSFREHNSDAKMIIIVNSGQREVFYDLDSKAYFFETDYDELDSPKLSRIPPHNFRFLEFLNLIEEADVDRVLISDIRDVIFQSNPFAAVPDDFPGSFLFLAAEDSNMTLRDDSDYSHWAHLVYGPDFLSEVASDPIVSPGFILGVAWKVRKLLRCMKQEMENISEDILSSTYVDQSILQKIYHSKTMHTKLLASGNLVGTIGHSLTPPHNGAVRDVVNVDYASRKILVNGNVPAIIHQYDRSASLKSMIMERYIT